MKTQEIKTELESRMEFGDIPQFSVEATAKYVYVCRNNGSFRRTISHEPATGGWATSLGRYTPQEAIEIWCTHE